MLLHFLPILFLTFIHPLHLSITNIDITDDAKNISVEIKLFTDDLEITLGHDHQIYSLDKLEAEQRKKIEFYIKEHFYIKQNSETLNWNNIYLNISDEYIVAKLIKKTDFVIQELTIYNTLLMDTHLDQINLVIVKHKKNEQGLRFNFKTREISWKINTYKDSNF